MNRHLARSTALQSLFEIDFDRAGKKENLSSIIRRNAKEFAPGMKDISFVTHIIEGVVSKKKEIDTIIEKAAPDWPIDKISPVDRNALRIGLYELLFGDRREVPPKVAINEAIELAKTFGGDKSGKFVNGVLGAVYKELGEPGKSDTGKKKKDVPYEKMPIEKLVGAIVYARDGGDIFLALIHDIFGHWTLTKGHLNDNEDEKDGVVRKAHEEMSAVVTGVQEALGKNEYIASDPEKGKIRKQVSYFLAEAKFEDLQSGNSGGIDDAKWFRLADVVNLNIYDDILPIVTKAINLLLSKK